MIERELEQKYKKLSNNVVLFTSLFFGSFRVISELIRGNFRSAAIVGAISAVVIGLFVYLSKKDFKYLPFIISFFIYTFYIGASFAIDSFKYFYVYYIVTMLICAVYFNVKSFFALLVITQITNLGLSVFVLPKYFDPINASVWVYFSLIFSSSILIYILLRFAVDKSKEVNNAFSSFGALMKVTPNVLILTDDDHKIKYLSNSVYKVFGIKRDVSLAGEDFLDLFSEDSVKEAFADIVKKRSYYEEYQKIKVDNDIKTFDVVADKMSDNAADGMFFMFNDVSELIRLKERAEHESLMDGLMQIPNRRAFDRQIAQEWSRALREQVNLSFLMIDIDFFKKYNDTYGHKQGDELLKTAGDVFKRCLKRTTDFVARIGGEEFGVLLYATNSYQANITAERIRKAVEDEIILTAGGEQTRFTVSIGISNAIPNAKLKPLHIFEEADKALYKAKQGGRNNVYIADKVTSAYATPIASQPL
jgi:diguanylate cyclase (GGDEF)-like protein